MPRVAPCRSSTVPHRPAPRRAHVPGQLAVFTLGSTPHVQTSSDAIPPPRSATEDTGLATPLLCHVFGRWRGQRGPVAGGGGGGRDSVSVSIPSPVSTPAPGRRSVQSCGKVVSAGASPPSLPPLFILLQVRESRTAGHDQKLATTNQSPPPDAGLQGRQH